MGKERKVTLEKDELFLAAQIGMMRRLKGIWTRATGGSTVADEYGNTEDGWNRDIQGAIAEFAFAKFMGLPWKNPTSHGYDEAGGKLPDVGGYEVRSTADPEYGLIIRANDKYPCVLIYGRDIEWYVMGWIEAERGRQVGRIISKPGRPDCWVVPKSHLAPLMEFEL